MCGGISYPDLRAIRESWNRMQERERAAEAAAMAEQEAQAILRKAEEQYAVWEAEQVVATAIRETEQYHPERVLLRR